MRKLRLYVGCSLTQAPKEFKDEVEELKWELREHFEVFDFVGLEKGTPADVYKWDIHNCVAKCDLFVAICDFPAIGLGYEMATAIEKLGKPTLLLVRHGILLTRLVLGIEHPFCTLESYKTREDMVRLIREKAALFSFDQMELAFEVRT
jgi:hypothetical protein